MKTVTVSEETKEDLRIIIADIINKKPAISFDELVSKYGTEEDKEDE